MKKLFLTSSIITANLIPDFEELIGKSIRNLKVGFIPDAGYAPLFKGDLSVVEFDKQELIDLYDWELTEVVLENSTPEDLKVLCDMDVIYVNGGLSGHLAKAMRKSGFDKMLPKLLDKGIVYVGSSGGSMVMSDVQDASSWFIGEAEPEAIDIPGLGYIDVQLYPHVTERIREDIKNACHTGFTYYLMKDGSAVMINGNEMQLLGDIEVFKKED